MNLINFLWAIIQEYECSENQVQYMNEFYEHEKGGIQVLYNNEFSHKIKTLFISFSSTSNDN